MEYKEKILAEIERLANFATGYYTDNIASGYKICCKDITAFINSIPEEPVSEDLEEVSRNYTDNEEYGDDVYFAIKAAFKAGAKWHKEQFEKNRLAACDKQTEEEAEIEQSFVMGIIEKEHRQPTFDDAIKYGMRLQKEKMMAKAFPVEIDSSRSDGRCILSGNFARFETGDKVKLVIINED